MTAIQAQSLPPILQGKDIIGKAKTGSGKTCAFALGLLNNLDVSLFRVQTLVLCPTRELADQVAQEIRRLARAVHNIKVLTLNGGTPFGPQVGSLEHGAHIIVGTPGRVEEHLRKKNLNLKHLNTFVLDEADRMLDSGFEESLNAIIKHVPNPRQSLLFSATFPDTIDAIANKVLRDPIMVEVQDTHNTNSIDEHFYQLEKNEHSDKDNRLTAIRLLLHHHRPLSTLVFCNTKRETQEVAEALNQHSFTALALHGDLEQKDRNAILVRFANKSASVLVATDVAARGLDIDQLDAVFNYHLSRELDVHTHRIGRTGRAGKRGIACTLFSHKEQFKIEKLEAHRQQTIELEPLPNKSLLKEPGFKAPMVTLKIDGGKKQKVRPGDILGALTGDNGIPGNDVGKITIFDFCAYVAVSRNSANNALAKLENGKIKGRNFRVKRI
jgi:ATP-independent RNA helicase DbpA